MSTFQTDFLAFFASESAFSTTLSNFKETLQLQRKESYINSCPKATPDSGEQFLYVFFDKLKQREIMVGMSAQLLIPVKLQ